MRSHMSLVIFRRNTVLILGVLMLLACSESVGVTTPLVIHITAPTAAVSVLVGDTVALSAVATDPRDGPLTGASVIWTIDSLPSFAAGLQVQWRAPSVGRFVIRARATSSSRAQATDSVIVTVGANSAPTIAASTLSPAARVYATDTVVLTMTASDAESGAIKGKYVQWVSSLDGPVGTGDTLAIAPRTLRAGTHLLTGYARDPQGFKDSTVLTLTVDSTSDRIKWTRRFQGTASFTLLTMANDGSMRFVTLKPFADCASNCMVAVAADGRDLWHVGGGIGQVSSHSSGMTIAPNGTTYLLDWQGYGRAINAKGTELWVNKLSVADPHGRLALAPNGTLYMTGNKEDPLSVFGSGGMLARIDTSNGALLWTINPSGINFHAYGAYVDPFGQAVGAPGRRWIWASANGTITRSDTTSLAWQSIHRSAMGADGSMYVISGESQTVAFAPDGKLRWKSTPYVVSNGASEPVVDVNNVVYIATGATGGSESFVQAFNGTNGTVLWTTPLPMFSISDRSYIALTDDGGIVAAVGNGIYALSSTGALRWSVPLMSSVQTNIVIAADGTIHVLTGDARLMAIRGDAPLATNAPWATYRADNRGTSSVMK